MAESQGSMVKAAAAATGQRSSAQGWLSIPKSFLHSNATELSWPLKKKNVFELMLKTF